jgi:5-methyltetrahydropteroyltriglutamate--homocysteine methyltransferase
MSTRYVVGQQLAAGIDVGNNGEQSRESFFTYVQHRMTGFGGRSERPIMRDIVRYPTFRKLMPPMFQRTMVDLLHAPKAVGEVKYRDRAAVDLECADTLRIFDDQPTKFAEPFMTAPSPGIIASAMLNEYYENYEKYVIAVAKALHTEYEYIVSKGFVLQVDCPDLAMERHTSYADRPLADFLEYVERNITAMNRALHGIAPDRVRMHVCWGNYQAPHDLDVPLAQILPLLYRANVGALVLEAANPRISTNIAASRNFRFPIT